MLATDLAGWTIERGRCPAVDLMVGHMGPSVVAVARRVKDGGGHPSVVVVHTLRQHGGKGVCQR